ncbi:sugar ABC transporter permease [Phycicoccus endophyticus]|uniref:Xylose transport system permease protein XylH n=1 Tax=Phycicoccus endophyticus TaxID=1690220 RepID=A0A7G9R0D5_9MICO|nr:sugar ABC transporter permease [Phycicoccus endophyticus]NHI20128.1 sugar ABC transporter permease [Phycicoccus endophyticus]QNN49060.1 sugar ABC transporter permease [Phycicoccus endophyticus]GGL38166.1 ABC transporter permease [Phycicoccus endophyticus]
MTASQTPPSTDPTASVEAPADLQDERLIASQGLGGWAAATWDRIRSGDLGSLPVVIGLVIIWAVFYALNPAFISSRNLVNLTLQMVPIGVLAIGVVLVLLLGEIDLSIGSMSGLSGAVLAVLFVSHGVSAWLAVLAALATGAVAGLVYGLLFNRFGVPSFVITLAGLLILLGLQLRVLGTDGTVNIPFESSLVQFASQQFLPAWLAYLLAVAVPALYLLARVRTNQRRSAAGLSAPTFAAVAVRAVLLALGLALAVYVLGRDRGLSYMVLLFLVLVVVMDLVIRRTTWGRSVLAIGGNVEAARRAGINVKRVYLTVFTLCSTFAALGGILAASRLASANQSSGGADTNLNAIAAAVIGGTSLFGGRGSAYSALLGIFVIYSISNGLALLSVSADIRYVVTGAVLLLAVVVDSLSRRSRAAHGRA